MTKARILVVEDERITALDLQTTLESLGYEVPAVASSADEALLKVRELKPDLVLMDIILDGPIDGIEAARRIRSERDIPVIYLTAFTDDETLTRAKVTEPFGYIVKPYQERELNSVIEIGLYKYRMERRVKHLNEVLRAIRNVNQLIVQEKDRDRLLQGACDCMTETRAYKKAWIIVQQEDGSLVGGGASGLSAEQRSYLQRLDAATIRPCLAQAQAAGELVVIEDPAKACGLCPVLSDADDLACLAAPVMRAPYNFGYLVVSTNREAASDRENQDLFSEMAGDLAYALHTLEIEAQRRRAEADADDARAATKRAEEDRRRLEGQLHESQKLEAIGRLAGGVAHDFNNILTAIRGFAELIFDDLPEGDEMAQDAMEIVNAAESGARLTGQLLAFSRKQIISPVDVDLGEVILRAMNLLKRLIGEDIDVAYIPQDKLWTTRADPGQMDQILINLALNARDAMPGGGKLTIETGNLTHDQSYSESHLEIAPGDYVMLAVSDSGHGIDAESLSHIFEPFYSTKSKGKGTGLGLAMVYGIVKQQGGVVFAYSEVGVGTTLKIYLPRVLEKAVPLAPPARLDIVTGSETVLVVEDSEPVREMAVRILRRAGYQVLQAQDGGDGFLQANGYDGPIHLLLTDVVMPNLNGKELVDKLVPLRPELRVLYMSGYTENAIAHRGILDADTSLLHKPFAAQKLLEMVREVLDS